MVPLYLAAWQPSPGDRPMYDGPDLPPADLPEDLTGPEPQSVPIDVSLLHRILGYESVGYYPDSECFPTFLNHFLFTFFYSFSLNH